ncbi:carboxypeptidase-like regulatory domain-containing protein [Aestuariibaculum suncheonense]|uniref:Carboxypeptidase-like regulatory domain-containing protein n=1 Tax=Aestuariibaculum suncheonense TaxID=1028745 RepID=A0A8J6UBU5_9FLAO|nr:carboxypeptidase-like regulatory domain-containing protein [Aestuariibaculum suncheonense]MBD0836593.1 carboxypeptidase-like regulatory domain-containing protein [Aestuariibaculum suncheonense]
MKRLFFVAAMLISAMSFSQNTGLVVGKIMDAEVNNAPLVLANVAIKGTETKVDTDQTGLFVIENLEAGDYTLVCSFIGYETKEINVHVDAFEPTELKLTLAASTISLDDLALLTATADKGDKALPKG